MAFAFPDSFRFADSHEYANADGDSELVRVGVSAFAVDQLWRHLKCHFDGGVRRADVDSHPSPDDHRLNQ